MIVGHCHSHSSNVHGQGHSNNHNSNYHHRHHHPHRLSRSGSESSREENEQYSSSSGGGIGGESSSSNNTPTSSDYSLAISSEMGERNLHRHPSTASLLDSIERRTQRTYRYGIGLVCVGATLNWLGFAQGTNYIDPLRYLGVACVLTGSFCVCLAMCRWLSKPISVSGHHVTNLEEERSNGDVHVINVAVPMYVPNLQEEYRPTKPPDYEQIVAGEEAFPPPYDEAVKLRPSEFFGAPTPPPCHHQGSSIVLPSGVIMDAATAGDGGGNSMYISQFSPSPTCQPSHDNHHSLHHHHQDLSRALLLDHQDTDSLIGHSVAPTPTPHLIQPHLHHQYLSRNNSISCGTPGEDPPPAYEPSPRPSISSCSSSAPLIPTSASRFDLPPSFGVRRMFGGGVGGVVVASSSSSTSPRDSPLRRRESISSSSSNYNSSSMNNNGITSEHLHDQVINEDVTLSLVVPHQQQQNYIPAASLQLGNSDTSNSNVINNNL